jgi:hypothetical protein
MLVTVARYRAITGDYSTQASAVSAAIERAEEDLTEVLERPLAEAERTERMTPTRDGWLWPKATPIVVATDHTINGLGLEPAWSSSSWPCRDAVDVTYTGGWVERTANPSAPNRLPLCIEEDLAWRARAIVCPDADGIDLFQIPAGATSVRLGDAAVSFAGTGTPGAARSEAGGRRWSRRTLGYRYRVTRSA